MIYLQLFDKDNVQVGENIPIPKMGVLPVIGDTVQPQIKGAVVNGTPRIFKVVGRNHLRGTDGELQFMFIKAVEV